MSVKGVCAPVARDIGDGWLQRALQEALEITFSKI